MAELKDKLLRLGSLKIVNDHLQANIQAVDDKIQDAEGEIQVMDEKVQTIESSIQTMESAIQNVDDGFDEHITDENIHVTSADRLKWDKNGISVSCDDGMLEFSIN